jgi:hypothetical protein
LSHGSCAIIQDFAGDSFIYMPTRRKFLTNVSIVAVTASLAPSTIFAAPLRFKEVPLEQVGITTFELLINAVFQVQSHSGAMVDLQLVEVQPGSSRGNNRAAEDAANEKFSLLFRGSLTQPLGQDSFWFEHHVIGHFAMFIVPIGSTETSHRYYEAVFNRPQGGPLPRAGEGNIPVGRARNKRRQF